ncbi:MAG: hypothetical protein JW741_06440 [Sedimentisphaerales bacterium]|nr:hypothetical protein [Sedimentisphaerales bacterium]
MVGRKDDLMRQESQENVYKIALAWFRREQWGRLLEVSEDRDELEETFDEWVQVAQQRYDELRSSGYDIKKIDVDVEELVRWCLAQDRPVNGEARADFALDKLR